MGLEVGAEVVVVVEAGGGVVEVEVWMQNSGPVPQFSNEEQHSFLFASQVSSATQHPTP